MRRGSTTACARTTRRSTAGISRLNTRPRSRTNSSTSTGWSGVSRMPSSTHFDGCFLVPLPSGEGFNRGEGLFPGLGDPHPPLKPLPAGEGGTGARQSKIGGLLEQRLYLNVAPLLRQPVLCLGHCRTPFVGAVSGFLRQQLDHNCGGDECFAVLLRRRFDRLPARSEPVLEHGREAEAAVGLLCHQEFKQAVRCGGALPLHSPW